MDEPAIENAADAGRPDPTPDATARRRTLSGTPVRLGPHEWILDGSVPPAGGVWDRLYDQNVLFQEYDEYDIRGAAFVLLLRNYALTADEAVALILMAEDAQLLVHAVEVALIDAGRDHRTWSQYVHASFWANGIDPDRVPPERIHDVLNILIATGRTVPADKWISADEAAAKRAGLLNFAKDGS